MDNCDICKYFEEDIGCVFFAMGSGNPKDAPCNRDDDEEDW